MADTTDYLTVYTRFFEEFATTVNPDDQLPVKVAGYYLCDSELVGEIVDWTLQYLNQKHCPSSLVAPLTRIVIDEIEYACKKQPVACGYRLGENTYQPLKLMQVVTGKVNEVCLRYRDNGKLATLPPPTPGPPISSCAIKNTRRRMEDRHVIIEDLHTVFNIQDRSPTSYYAVFDGHAGTDAAMYSVSHLHQFLAESSFYPTDPERALKDAFSRTDSLFLEKSNRENLRSGTTAVCALLRPKEKMLYVAWLGDSQALLVRKGQTVQVVNPHKPDRQDERERIEDMGGCVLYWGTWRVNGQLAVSRAIGDLEYKPYVTAEPDVTAVPLNGTEDFLVLACDGLWDFVTEQEAVVAVYQQVSEAPGDLEAVSQRLVQLSKQQGSTDNISVIVVFLTDPAQLASRPVPQWATNGPPPQEARAMETSFDHNTNNTSAGNNPFLMNPTSDSVPYQKAGLLLDLGGAGDAGLVYKHNGTSPSSTDLYFLDRPANGKKSTGVDNYEDDDFGPETDVDSVDDVLLSPATAKPAALNPFGGDEKRALEADLELQRQQLSDFDPVREPREETPTPPADEVPGVTTLVPESDNVAESGEDSEDEWSYIRVDPIVEGKEQAAQPICQKPAKPQLEEDESNMESQLNPDAAEFVPSPTQMMPSMEEVLLAQSPNKGIPMEDISVPSQLEFQHEVSQRPSELDLSNESPLLPEIKMASKLPDLINNEEGGDNANPFLAKSHLLGDGANNILEQEEQNGVFSEQNSSVQGLALDESEVSSTKAEFGDDSTMSFMTIGSELQKTVTESASSLSAMEKSFADQDLLGTEFTSGVAKSDNGSTCDDNELSEFNESEVLFNKSVSEEAALHEEGCTLLENAVPLCFELQQELVPEMESNPERVQLESEGTPSFDDSGSPLQAEHKKVEELEEPAIISLSPVTSPIPDLHPPVPEETAVTPQIPEPSLQDLEVADMPSSPVEPSVSDLEAKTDLPTQLQSPSSTQTPLSPLWGSTSRIQCVANSTSSTPETVPLEKETQSPSPKLEVKPSLVGMPFGASVREIEERLGVQLQSVNIEERVERHDPLEIPELHDLENGLYSRFGADSALLNPYENMSDCDISDPRHPLNQGVCSVTPQPATEFHSALSDEDRKLDMTIEEMNEETEFFEDIQRHEKELIKFSEMHNVVTEIIATQVPPPTPAHVSEEALQLSNTEVSPAESTQVPPIPAESTEVPLASAELTDVPPVSAESTQVLEHADDAESKGGLVVAATAAATVATAVAAGSVLAHEEKPAEETKAQEKKAEAKKSTPTKDKKGPTADKSKTKTPTSTRTPTGTIGAARTLQKSTPTSPTKPPSTILRSSTPKKPLTSTSHIAGKTTKPPATANKLKPGATSPMKPLSFASKPASASQRPRPGTTASTTTAKSTALSNGDVNKTAVAKKTTTSTTAKPLTRPATAPATTKTGTMKQLGTNTSRTITMSAAPPRPKPGAMNGVASKTRPAGTVATARNKVGSSRDTKLVTDKQVKETANKQISSARTITSKTTTATAARNTTATAARKVSGVPKSTVTTVTVKSSTVKVGPKKTSTTTSAIRASPTASTKPAMTEVTVTSTPTENNEIVQAQVD